MNTYAVLGPPGTYSEEAAAIYWPQPYQLVYTPTIDQVFTLVMSGGVDAGLVPLANSQAGSISATMKNLLRHQLYIGGEMKLPVKHCLLAKEIMKLEEIELIISQPTVFIQCENFLAERLPRAKREIVASTAHAARCLHDESRKAAAIGSRQAGTVYGLVTIAEGLEDDKDNYTTFIQITREPQLSGTKTSLIFGLHDQPGALYQALGVFARRGINLTKLESRPQGNGLSGYVFFTDLQGGINHPLLEEALNELAGLTQFCRFLGSYQAAEG